MEKVVSITAVPSYNFQFFDFPIIGEGILYTRLDMCGIYIEERIKENEIYKLFTQ